MNRARMATDTLKKLAESKDRRTAIFARTTLLGSGDRDADLVAFGRERLGRERGLEVGPVPRDGLLGLKEDL